MRFDPALGRAGVTTFLLVRHGHCEPVGQAIAGRSAGVHLSERGKAEVTSLASRLSALPITAVYSSPLERALETAAPIAERKGLLVATAPGLIEIDFGEWTGKTLAELDRLPAWQAFNRFRSGARIPGGEGPADVLSRSLAELDRLSRAHPDSRDLVVVVSHGDVLRSLVAHFLGCPLDLLHRFELSPASVSVLQLESYGPRLLQLNWTADGPDGVLPDLRR